MIAKSAMDSLYTDDIEYNKENVLVIIEGLSMYLHENDIREIFSIIEKAFNKSTVMIETMSPFFVKHMKEKSIEGSNAKFSWGVKNGKDLQQIVPAFNWKLAQVFELSVFEPVYMEGEDDIYAAYLMNDSVESYFVFENSIMTGEYKDIDCEQVAGIETLSDGYMLIVNQGGENIFTIRFNKLGIKTTYFNYGSMGHFWVKGYEYLRQLEYQLADVRDKYRYLGSSSCTSKELIFMQLADFPPIKKYKSVPEAYYVPYPDAVYSDAVNYLIDMAVSVGDKRMAGMLKCYLNKPDIIKCNIIAAMFHRKAHSRFIDKLIMDVRNEADNYVKRTFNSDEEAQYKIVHNKALKALDRYKEAGYECLLYREEPFMYSKDSITYKEHILVFRNGRINRKCDIYTYEA